MLEAKEDGTSVKSDQWGMDKEEKVSLKSGEGALSCMLC